MIMLKAVVNIIIDVCIIQMILYVKQVNSFPMRIIILNGMLITYVTYLYLCTPEYINV